MKNVIDMKGEQIALPTATAYVSGDIVLEGDLGGVAVADAADSKVTTKLVGVVEVPAVDASYTVGQKVEATAAQGSVQALSAGELYGFIVEAATISGGGNVKVLLAR